MQVEVLLFGQLTDITGTGKICLQNVNDTDELASALIQSFPAMAHIRYLIAVDKKMINSNTAISEKTELALLPAFSGG